MTDIIIQKFEIHDSTWDQQTSEGVNYEYAYLGQNRGSAYYEFYGDLPDGGWKPLTVVESTIRGYATYAHNPNTETGVDGIYVPFHHPTVPEGKFIARFMVPVQEYLSPAMTGWFKMAFYRD